MFFACPCVDFCGFLQDSVIIFQVAAQSTDSCMKHFTMVVSTHSAGKVLWQTRTWMALQNKSKSLGFPLVALFVVKMSSKPFFLTVSKTISAHSP